MQFFAHAKSSTLDEQDVHSPQQRTFSLESPVRMPGVPPLACVDAGCSPHNLCI